MSRIGRQPITLPSGVTVTIEPEKVTVKGPGGELSERISRDITVEQTSGDNGDQLVVSRPTDRGEHRALHGLTRTLVANMVVGVTDGFTKELEIVGVGYRATARGSDAIDLALGFSHPVPFQAPAGVTFEVPAPTQLHDDEGWVDWSYINHVAVNGGLVACTFNDPHDEKALRLLADAYRGRHVSAVDARVIFSRGGGIHCITQQQPATPAHA
jgi:large subunit ribosomal protein L6